MYKIQINYNVEIVLQKSGIWGYIVTSMSKSSNVILLSRKKY